ncbi:IclR family transcriptional regulator (plasmid) [Bartonella sp. HY329]|uniref:IclR family transcriptional regulator n=1 Tax=unclassified Bartonella TaxID=2645622 RepID=UPI0021C9220A|nr:MULTISPECIES: IclR family transcriptional regulator [unclassified Bartonella]UXM96544.1 IclR family transcriptional regulator [Bartonella sp. HY329]UXN10867.1 IclR family transcriptional regulator [Bartonella sp. HY328]
MENSAKKDGTQSIERALQVMQLVASAGQDGIRLTDIIKEADLHKPTVRRLLIALIRSGMVEQDSGNKRYFIGPEAFLLGLAAGSRFSLHQLSIGSLMRLAKASGDSVFVSVRRNNFSVCLHCEEGAFPIRTQVLKPGDRHPLGIGAGSLAMLSALGDDDIAAIIDQNQAILRDSYPNYSNEIIWRGVEETRKNGYAFNPGILMPGSWGMGLAVNDAQDQPLGAISIAAIENRLDDARRAELLPLLREEVAIITAALRSQRHLKSHKKLQDQDQIQPFINHRKVS